MVNSLENKNRNNLQIITVKTLKELWDHAIVLVKGIKNFVFYTRIKFIYFVKKYLTQLLLFKYLNTLDHRNIS